MLFNSIDFLLFFPIVVFVYYLIPYRIKNLWLLAASYYFYMSWNTKYALLILFSTLVTYIGGILLEKFGKNRLVVTICVVLNLSILFFFKYIGFTVSILQQILQKINIVLTVPEFDILLPVGISFYTFQALSYTIDVYRGEIEAEHNLFRYALFVSFFPQLVAGPIERSGNLLRQLNEQRRFSYNDFRIGVGMMLWGYFLKIVVADRVAIFVDTIYGNYADYYGWYIVMATMLFAMQIYCDFYGYSMLATGAARILGIRLTENFKAPYLSISVSDFWRRWHISLMGWFRDYLYIPLGGSRKGKLRTYINRMIVFLISGLWHGASLAFVVWGGLNGLYQVVGEALLPIRSKLLELLHVHRASAGYRLVSGLCTFVLVDFSWIFFRAGRLNTAIDVIYHLFSENNAWVFFDGSFYECGLDVRNFWLMIICIGVVFLADICNQKGISIWTIILRQDYWFRYTIIALIIVLVSLFGIWGPEYDEASFLYFQF